MTDKAKDPQQLRPPVRNKCKRICMVTVNVIFMILGLSFAVAAIVFKFKWAQVKDAFSPVEGKTFSLASAGETFSIGVIIFGIFVILVACIGILGTMCNSRLLLTVYAIIIILVVIAEIAIVAVIAMKGTQAEEELTRTLVLALTGYNETSKDVKSIATNTLFYTLTCCGVNNSTDFYNPAGVEGRIKWFHDKDRRGLAGVPEPPFRPIICCRNVHPDQITEKTFVDNMKCLQKHVSTGDDNAVDQGCYTKLYDLIVYYKHIVLGIGLTIVFLELAVIVLACFMCCRDDVEQYYKRAKM